MNCCTPSPWPAGPVFSRLARCYRWRYDRHGLDRTQRWVAARLAAAGVVEGAVLLDVGCGVGDLHQRLLEQGAARAVGVDLAERMIEEARRGAQRRGLAERTDYRVGDFLAIAAGLPDADVTLLDKVLCCYPDADGILAAALPKTRRACAVVIPRPHWVNRLGVRVLAAAMWLARCGFRNYLHDPAHIEAQFAEHGFRRDAELRTPIWLARVYIR